MKGLKENQPSFTNIVNQICKEGLCHRPQLLFATWQATKKAILHNSTHSRITLLANSFISWSTHHNQHYQFHLEPTDITLKECGIKIQNTYNGEWDQIVVVKQQNLYTNLHPSEKEYFKSDKELLLRFLYLLVGKIKQTLKTHKNIQFSIQNFGMIKTVDKVWQFEGSSFNEKIFSPSQKYKRVHLKQNSFDRTEESKLSLKYNDTINEQRTNSRIKKRPYFHQLIKDNEPNSTRICNDLLGAGLDPLTCNINHSKLIDHSSQLLSKEFAKPNPFENRYPCIIDKFARTKGSQLTSLKVGNTIVVRIGCNYSPSAKSLYLDITTKSIQRKTQEVKIKLDNSKSRCILPASESEQYSFLTGKHSKYLESRVELRKQVFQRYCQYYKHLIPNDCVAVLEKQSIEKIIGQVKYIVRKLGKKDGSPLINGLMAEANKQYYLAYKKSVLDYILKDKEEMVRTGINLTFKRVPQWGKPVKKYAIRTTKNYQEQLKQSKKQLELNHIHYPECLNKIYLQNQKINYIDLFRKRRQGQYRPFSLLYYIKRNVNQLNEAFNSLCQGWIKKVAQIIEQSINLKQQSYQKLKQFFNSIHVIMSNKLKQIVYNAISQIYQELSSEGISNGQVRSLLLINLTQNNQKINFIDDIDQVFRFQLLQIITKIVETTRRVPRVETYLKLSNDLFVWGIDQKDTFIAKTRQNLRTLIQENYKKINHIRENLLQLESMFTMTEKVAIWCKDNFNVIELHAIFDEIKRYQERIEEIKCYYMADMVVIDCIELKKKLTINLKQLKKLIFETADEYLRSGNQTILNKIRDFVQAVNKSVKNTKQYVHLSQSIDKIKQVELPTVRNDIENNYKDAMQMFSFEGFMANIDVMRSTYLCRVSYEELTFEIYRNEKRLHQERLDLEKKLRDKIARFQADTLSCFKDISLKIDSFDMRKLYCEYIGILTQYIEKVDTNKLIQKELNQQEEDLKWTSSTFPHAKDLENIVEPNFQLWKVVAEYDQCVKEWKYIELSHFDIDNAEIKIKVIDGKVTKLIPRLKNFAGLKIIYDLQNDVKEFLGQQVSIIRIFSNPGLKDRHWNLFNKRLPLSGYDLKELTFGRIKLLYQYEKNLKVLMSISNQAAKEFEIQNQKQQMHQFWNKLQFSLKHSTDEHLVFVDEEFLDTHLALIDQHLTKTVILKNSPFSKALVALLSDWENWLVNGRKILEGFLSAQRKFLQVRAIFRMDEINKLLPIESTQYDSIEGIWKSVMKKISDHSRVAQFLKSPKMPDIIEEMGRKADFIKSSFSSYLALKRTQFTRLYFLPENFVLQLITLQANNNIDKTLQLIGWNCFTGVRQCYRQDNLSLVLRSSCDELQVKCESLHSKKGKSKFFEELVVLQKNMRLCVREEIKNIKGISLATFDKFTLTSIFTALELEISHLLKSKYSQQSIFLLYNNLKTNLVKKLEEEFNLKYQLLLSKLIFICQRCNDLKKTPQVNLDQILLVQNADDGNININYFNQTLKYNNEYLGDQVPAFIPQSSDKLVWQIASSLNQNVAMLGENNDYFRQIAHFAGQYYVNLINPLHNLSKNFESCVMGVVTTNYWVNFNDYFIKINCDLLAQLTHAYQLKKQMIEKNKDNLTFGTHELNINKQTMVFITLPPSRYTQLPEGLLTCTRSVSIVIPELTKLKTYLEEYEHIISLKLYLQKIKFQCGSFDLSTILQKIQCIHDWEEIVFTAKAAIWKHISSERQAEFINIFFEGIDQRDQIQCKNADYYIQTKKQQLEQGLKWSDIALVVGQQSCKSTIIQQYLQERQIQLYNENRGMNLNFIEEGISEMSLLKYLEKGKQKVGKQGSDIYIYIDSDVSQQELYVIQQFMHLHNLSSQKTTPLKVIIETNSLSELDPQSIVHASLVSVKSASIQDQFLYKNWVEKLQLGQDDKTFVSQLEISFNKIINFIMKMEKRPFSEGKLMLTRRFFNFFQVFLNNLNGKEVQRMCQLEKQNYIFNSFIYCIFWALGVCSLRNIQIQALKKHINELFGEKLDLPGELEQIYLGQDNDWVFWDSLRQDYTNEKENLPFYQIWVPTANNTKLLTMMVKLIERNNSVMLCGSQSGKSSLLNEISCYELSYNSFFIDCHKNTSTHHIATLTKGKVLYGQSKNNLILIDDLHLPRTQTCGIIRTFIQRGYCANSSSVGKLNQYINKPTVLTTWKGNNIEGKRCFWRLFGKTIPIQTQSFQPEELQFIFKTYLSNLWNQDSHFNTTKLEKNIVNYCLHTLKTFPLIEPQHLRLIIESTCRFNIEKGQHHLLEHILVETQSILAQVIPNHDKTHFFRHMCHYYSKFLSVQLKNQHQFNDTINNFTYFLQENQHTDKKQTIEETTNWMQQTLKQKNQTYLISQFHCTIIQRLFWSIKNNASHTILVSSFNNGSRTMAKMAAYLLNISVDDCKDTSVESLLEQVVKVLKTGGKADECVKILGQDLVQHQPNLLKLVHSLIFSPEFHECFGQILMEQIIKSFNAEKKFLKKNVKKAELIKKIRQKFNMIYHFCLCVSKKSFNKLMDEYPKFKGVRIIEIDSWPNQALSTVSKRFVADKSDQVFRAVSKIQVQIKTKWENLCKCSTISPLNIFSLYEKVMKMIQSKAGSYQSAQIWSKKVKINKQKIESLELEKKVYEVQHFQYHESLKKLTNDIKEVQNDLQKQKAAKKEIQKDVQTLKQQCSEAKIIFQNKQGELNEQYQYFIEVNKAKILLESDRYLKRLEQIAKAYELSIQKANPQLIKLLQQMKNDYFGKLNNINHEELGTVTQLINQFQYKMKEQMTLQQELSSKFTSYETKEGELRSINSNIQETFIKLRDLNDDQVELREEKEPGAKSFDEIVKKIELHEAIMKILQKYQYVLKSKNDLINNPSQIIGSALLITLLLSYYPILEQNKIQLFKEMIISKIKECFISINEEEIKSFFSQEDQFLMKNKYMADTDEWVNLFALQSGEMSFVTLGQPEVITQWVERSFNKKQNVWLKEDDNLVEMLQEDRIIYVNNPSKELAKKISYIMTPSLTQTSNGKVFLLDDQEVIVNNGCKIIFIFKNSEDVLPEIRASGLFILRIFEHNQNKIKQELQQYMREQKMLKNRSEYVEKVLKGYEQIGVIDDKMHAIIARMRKQNVVSEIVVRRIEEQGQNKLVAAKKIEENKEKIAEINRALEKYEDTWKNVFQIYESFKTKLNFKTYLSIFRIALNLNTSEDIESVINIEKYLEDLTDRKEISQQELNSSERIISQLFQQDKVVLKVFDLSIGSRWAQSILQKDGKNVNKIYADSVTINSIKEKEFNIILVSRNAQFDELTSLLSTNQQRLKDTKILIICLQHLQLPLFLKISTSILNVTNPNVVLFKDTIDKTGQKLYNKLIDNELIEKCDEEDSEMIREWLQ